MERINSLFIILAFAALLIVAKPITVNGPVTISVSLLP